jgi:hypothetical protein
MLDLMLDATRALLGTLVGLVLALLSIASIRWQGRRFAPNDPHRFELVSWAIYLFLAAAIYVAFALREAGWMRLELAGLVVYTALAWCGVRRPRLLALGWLLHAGWDAILHADAPETLVPGWYRWACLGFDVVAAIHLTRLSAPGRSSRMPG